MNDIKDTASKSEAEKNPITIRLPRFSEISLRSVIFFLLIAVGVLQTVQLFGLRSTIANASVKPSISAPASGGSGGAQLPTMVGGC